MSSKFRCARVAIIGRPNAGKSTLMNALLQSELSATSSRPQTTRSNVKGILQLYSGKPKKWDAQLVLVDTPGVNLRRGLLDRSMYTAVEDSLREVDLIVWVSDPRTLKQDLRDIEMEKSGEDKLVAWLLDQLRKKNTEAKWVLAISKIDGIKKASALPLMQKVNEILPEFSDIIPVAAQLGMKDKNSNLTNLVELLKNHAPEASPLFGEEEWTNLNQKELIQNLVRESIFRNNYKEVPYESDCVIERFQEPAGSRRMAEIDASIVVSRQALKAILVGKGGEKIRDMGISVRKKYKDLTGDEIVLRLFVKVEAKWNTQSRFLKELGYASRD